MRFEFMYGNKMEYNTKNSCMNYGIINFINMRRTKN